MAVAVRPAGTGDRSWIRKVVTAEFRSVRSVSRDRLFEDVTELESFVAEVAGERAGVASFNVEGDELELVILIATVQRSGVGTALLRAVEEEAARRRLRPWLITTNDNVDALRFYQRCGWDLFALHRDALAESRRLKPEISETGAYGIPIRHELELRPRA